MHKRLILSLMVVFSCAGTLEGTRAQTIQFQESGSGDQYDMTLSSLSSLGDGNYTLPKGSGTAWVNNLSNNNVADIPTTLTNFQGTGGGWVYSSTANSATIGNIWLANTSPLSNPGLLLGDPTIAYSVAFQNTTDTSQTFTLSLSIPINPAITFNPSQVRATVAGSVLDAGGADGFTLTPILPSTIGGSGLELQTATLTGSSGTVSAGVDLTSGIISSLESGANKTIGPITTFGYNNYITGPSGTFNTLTLNLGVELSAGDFASFTGRVDVVQSTVVPEPSSLILAAMGLGFLLLLYFRKAFPTPESS